MTDSTRERLIEITIAMIDELGGAGRVSMREVARRAGCAAPNVYNHFADFADLLNAANLRIIADFDERVPARAMRAQSPAEMLELGARAFVEYAVEHKGWFNSFHYERHDVPLSAETGSAAEETGQQMMRLVQLASPTPLTDEAAAYVTRAIHSHLLGELSGVVTGKERPLDEGAYVERLTNTCIALFRALIHSPLPDMNEVLT